MAREERSFGEHVRETTRRRSKYRRRKTVEHGIRATHRELYRGRYDQATDVLIRRVIEPMGLTRSKLPKVKKLLENADLCFDFFALSHFLENKEYYFEILKQTDRSRVNSPRTAASRAEGVSTEIETARKRLENAFLTVENVAIAKGLVRSGLSNSVWLEGYTLPVGVVYKDFGRSLPDPVKLYDSSTPPGATAVQGRPGKGKTLTLKTFGEDRYAAGHKVIDFLDWQKAENILWDVPMAHDELVEKRADLDLPRWWDEIDDVDEPEVEILLPLTPELASSKIPVDVVENDTKVRPFTIPAADVDKRALKAFMTHTTDVGSSTLERAFKEVRDLGDWKLVDLASAVRRVADDPHVADRLRTNLTSLQKSSFIRDRKDDHAIEWEPIFRDTSTITCFSVSNVSDDAEKYMIMLYLTSSLRRERERLHGLPTLTALWQELNLVAPPESKKTKDPRHRALEGALIDEWSQLMTLHRHVDVEVIADTQEFESQVNSDVRAKFGKGITYRHKRPWVRRFWKAYGAELRKSYIRRVATQFQPGDFAYLGDSNVEDRSFHSPCYLAPPMSHHFDNKTEDHGFLSRADYLDREELRPAPWDASLPRRFEIRISSDEPTREDPVAFFAYHHIKDVDIHEWVAVDDVYSAYRGFAVEQDLPRFDKQKFGKGLRSALGDSYEKKEKMVDGERFAAYFGLDLDEQASRKWGVGDVEGVEAGA